MNTDRNAIEVTGKALVEEVNRIVSDLPRAGFGSSYEDVEFVQGFVRRSMHNLLPRFEELVVAIQLAGCMKEPDDLHEFDLIDIMRDRITDGFHAEQERVRKIAAGLRTDRRAA